MGESYFAKYVKENAEDCVGCFIAMSLFCMSLIISYREQDLSVYSSHSPWPFGALSIGLFVVALSHFLLKVPLLDFLPAYGIILIIAVVSRAIGDYLELAQIGLSASLWAILLGCLFRTSSPWKFDDSAANYGISGTQYVNDKKLKPVLKGEYFVKVGVTLLAMDFSSIVAIGLPGLMIAWGDTLIVLAVGCLIGRAHALKPDEYIIVSTATCVCGSSAATAVAKSIGRTTSPVVQTIITYMSIFNAPLIPLLPIIGSSLFFGHPAVTGAWIGGSIDSTGQVTASGQIGGDQVLQTAVIIKMAQNVLIGPLCLFFTMFSSYFLMDGDGGRLGRDAAAANEKCSANSSNNTDDVTHSQPLLAPDHDIVIVATDPPSSSTNSLTNYCTLIVFNFPIFVIGFLITSAAVTAIRNSPDGPDDHGPSSKFQELVISNAWVLSEWITLIGFSRLGLEIDVFKFMKELHANKAGSSSNFTVLTTYLAIQLFDLFSTLGWAYLMFSHKSINDENDSN